MNVSRIDMERLAIQAVEDFRDSLSQEGASFEIDSLSAATFYFALPKEQENR